VRTSATYRNLEVWNLAMDLTAEIYLITKAFPRDETYGIRDQMRRAATSIPTNIAEGSGRHTRKDFAHFLYIANGSLRELETLVFLSARLGYVASIEDVLVLTERVGMMLTKLRQSLSRDDQRPTTNDQRPTINE
jgi:four helix bundle protein